MCVCVCCNVFAHSGMSHQACHVCWYECACVSENESNAVGVLIIVYNIRANGKAKEFTVIGYLK